MSEEPRTEVTATPQPAPTTPAITAALVFSFVKDNFVLVSAAAALLGVTLSTTFLAAYLSVFDWHLLWFVQYTDIITIGLLALGVITVSMIFIQTSAQTVLGLLALEGHARWRHAIFLLCIVAIIVGFEIWAARESGEGVFHILMGVSALSLGILFIIQVMRYVKAATLPNMSQAFFLVMGLGIATIGVGQWLGYSVLESAKGQEVTLKDKTLSDMKVVVVMARHTILFKDHFFYVLPTADITGFKVGDQFTPSKPAAAK